MTHNHSRYGFTPAKIRKTLRLAKSFLPCRENGISLECDFVVIDSHNKCPAPPLKPYPSHILLSLISGNISLYLIAFW